MKILKRPGTDKVDRPIYGMTTDPASDILKQMRWVRKAGFDFFEIGLEPPEGDHMLLMKRRKALLKELGKFPHPPVAHSPYWYELWSCYDDVRNAWVKVVKETIDVAKSLGCRTFNIHAPIPHGGYAIGSVHWDRSLDLYIRSMREIVRHARTRGVTVMMENMGPYGAVFGEYGRIMRSVPGLAAHIDIGHAFLEGGMPMVRKYLNAFKEKIVHFHFTDNLGLSDDHLGIGSGIIDYFAVMKHLKRMKYSGTVSLEIISTKKEVRQSLDVIRAIQEEVWPR